MGKFTSEDIALAQKVQQNYGVPASVTLGQYALESGYGKSTVGDNNYFNIKGNGNGGYANYDSKEESFMAFGELLSKERYTSKTSNATTIEEYVQGVKDGGYAEDKYYVTKVMSIINQNDLTQYDTGNLSVNNSSLGTDVSNDNGLTWWGDIVKVVFILLLVVGGVLFIGLGVTSSKPVQGATKEIKKVVKVVK